MKNSELESIRSEYKDLLNLRAQIIDKLKKIEDLEKNPFVKEYLKLREELESDNDHKYTHMERLNDFDMLKLCYNKVNITETNNIYVYTGTFKNDINDSLDTRVNYDSENALYSKYSNIELQEYNFNSTMIIPISKREEFEKNNIVIFPKNYLLDKTFYDIQNDFFLDAMELGQEKAIEKLLKKYK